MLKLSQLFVCALSVTLITSVGYTKGSASSTNDSGTRAASGSGDTTATAARMIVAVDGGDTAHGKTLYAVNCASCHGATGTEGGVGPSLKGEKGKKDLAAAVAWIKNPKPPMPKLYPSPLSDNDVRDVAAYVETL